MNQVMMKSAEHGQIFNVLGPSIFDVLHVMNVHPFERQSVLLRQTCFTRP